MDRSVRGLGVDSTEHMASGYLFVTRYEVIYEAALQSGRYDKNPVTGVTDAKPIYGLPHPSRPILTAGSLRYRGIDREPLGALSVALANVIAKSGVPCEATPATALLDEIELATGREDGWLTELADVQRVWAMLNADQAKFEVIFGKEYEDNACPPAGAQYLGSDAAYFVPDHFSCICDSLFIPRWHGTDLDGTLFREHFEKLNCNGLFRSNQEALDYLRYYLSIDWTERADNFTSIEVYSVSL